MMRENITLTGDKIEILTGDNQKETIHCNVTRLETRAEIIAESENIYIMTFMGYGNSALLILTSGWCESEAFDKCDEPADTLCSITELK